LVVSASEWAASASIAAEPLIAPAAIFAIAIVALEASAIDAVRRLSALRPGRRLRLLAWTAGRGRGAVVSAALGMFDLYPTDGRAEHGYPPGVIDFFSARAFTVPTEAPESDGTLEWDSTTVVVVEVEGGGERGIGYTYSHAAAATVVESVLAPLVVGSDPMAPPRTWAAMRGAVRNLGFAGLAAMAISAVDIALWDLRAKLLGLALVDSLGRARDEIVAYGSGGFTSLEGEALADQLRGWADEGFGAVKMKVGRDPGRDPQRLAAAREAIGPDVALMVDANGAFDRREALRQAELYAESGASYLEEPVSSEDLEGLAWLRDRVPAGVEIAAGEYLWSVAEAGRMAPCVDVLQADVTRCGGITGVLALDGICAALQTPFSAHCAPQVSAHLCCAMGSAVHVEYFADHARLEPLLFEGAIAPAGGALRPDRSRPGLGLVLRPEATRFLSEL
jgi:L-alanine-DL-glutamate epimerase-like enolase superfamily enzyme